MTNLWTFENQGKAEPFIASLKNADITFEIQTKSKQKTTDSEVTILVDEREYEKAKRMLIKHRKRRTTS